MKAFKVTKDKSVSTVVTIRKIAVNSRNVLFGKQSGRHEKKEKQNEDFARNILTAQVRITARSFSGQEL